MTALYAATALSSFVFVFLKAFQQRNVAFDHYVWIVPTSYAMAFAEFLLISSIVQINGWDWIGALALGTGGGFGALLSVLVHKKFLTRS